MFTCITKNIVSTNILEIAQVFNKKSYNRENLLSLLNRDKYAIEDKIRDEDSKEVIRKIRKFINVTIFMDKSVNDIITTSMALTLSGYVDVHETMNGYLLTMSLDDLVRYIKVGTRLPVLNEIVSFLNSIVPKSLVFDIDEVNGSNLRIDSTNERVKNDILDISIIKYLTPKLALLNTKIDFNKDSNSIMGIADANIDTILKMYKVPLIVNDIRLLDKFSNIRNIELMNPVDLYASRMDIKQSIITVDSPEGIYNMDDSEIDKIKISSKGLMLLLNRLSNSKIMNLFANSKINSFTTTSFLINISLFDLYNLMYNGEDAALSKELDVLIKNSGVSEVVDEIANLQSDNNL